MKEIKVGTRVAFMRDGVIKNGTVQKIFYDIATAIVVVPGEEEYSYKVLFSDLNVISEPNDQAPAEKLSTITPTEFETIVGDLMELICDQKLKDILKLFSQSVFYRLFGFETKL